MRQTSSRPGASADGPRAFLDRHILWRSSFGEVSEANWDRHRHPADRSRLSLVPAIVLIHSGCYVRQVGHRRGVGDVCHVSLYNQGDVQHISHPMGLHTRGTTIVLPPATLDRLIEAVDPGRKVAIQAPFPVLSRRLPAATHLLCRSLLAHLRDATPPDAILVEETLLSLTEQILRDSLGETGGGAARMTHALDGVRGRIPHIVAYMNEAFPEALTLEELADLAACSPWHLSRVFREEVGTTIARYVGRLRARRALQQVLDGSSDLTRVALDAGFSSHSHFTTTFRREFGISPSTVRDMPHLARVRWALQP